MFAAHHRYRGRTTGMRLPTSARPAGTLPCIVLVLAVSATALTAQVAARRHSYTGVTIGLDLGRQNIIGGSQVAGIDVLQQASRLVAGVSIGGRVQAPFGTVLGAEVGRGWTDGNLQLVEPSPPLTVSYHNRRQSHWQLTLGQAVGARRRNLLYIYVSEVSRGFDVEIVTGTETRRQRDEQGLLRYGLGYERAVSGLFAFRGTVGTSRADFGTQRTNITPRRVVDLSAGLLFTP